MPPLYDALKRMISWLDKDIDTPKDEKLPALVSDRRPWWELVVLKAQEKEYEVLCLT